MDVDDDTPLVSSQESEPVNLVTSETDIPTSADDTNPSGEETDRTGDDTVPISTQDESERSGIASPIRPIEAGVEDKTEESGPLESEKFLPKILSEDEISSIENGIRIKIEDAVQEKFNLFLVSQALSHTSRVQQEETISTLQRDLEFKETELEELRLGWKEGTEEISSLRNQLETAASDVRTANETCKKMRYEWQDFKTQRDLACDEKDSLLAMIERRDNQIATLKEELTQLADKCDAAVAAKIGAMEDSHEVESLKISLKHKEERLNQENALIRSQIAGLEEELEIKSADLRHARYQQNQQSMTLETELAAKTEEVRILTETVTDLRETNDKLTDRAEKLVEKIASQRESYDTQIENFHQELASQRKLAQLYKSISDGHDSKTEKLTQANDELKGFLDIATERYGELEEKFKNQGIKYKEEIAKRDECIQHLQKELLDANELLKVTKLENVDAAIGTLSPSAAAASRLLKSGVSLTQIYTQYARISEELELSKEECRRLNLYVATIVKEIEEKAPLLQQQRLDYEKAVASATSLTKEMDHLISESQVLNHECTEAKKISSHLKRENERLKKENCDLARQVCYLVKAVEEARGGVVSHDTAYEMRDGSAQEVISKHLVTFRSIEDLQENNQKLLALVRQLSEKHEAVESVSVQQYHDLQSQKDRLQQQVTDMLNEMGRQTKMIDLIRSQVETYKKLYQQAMGGELPPDISRVMADETGVHGTPVRKSPAMVTSTPMAVDNKKSEETKEKLEAAKEKISKLEEEIIEVRKISSQRESELLAKLDKLSEDSRDWMFKNSKLVASSEYHEERAKVLETNAKTLRKQLSSLEDRNRTVSEICSKHEMTIQTLKEETMNAQTQVARLEVQRKNLQQEVAMLKAAEARLIKERETLQRDKINNSLLMNNIDGLKATLARSEEEGKLRLEIQLSEAVKECVALRSTLQEEKNKFKEITASLERQTQTAKQRMEEEKALADRARADLDAVKADLENKMAAVQDLNNQIRELKNQPSRSVIEAVTQKIDVSVQRVKELEKEVFDLKSENSKLQIQLNSAQASNEQYIAICEATHTQLSQLASEHEACGQKLAKKEEEWMVKKNEVAAELLQVRDELKKIITDREKAVQSSSGDVEELKSKILSLEAELSDKCVELETEKDNSKDVLELLERAKQDVSAANGRAEEVEERYSQEVIAHSKALQASEAARAELEKLRTTQQKIVEECDVAKAALAAHTNESQKRSALAADEMKKLVDRASELDEQNTLLHNSIQELNDQLALLQAKVSAREDTSDLETSMNTSTDLSGEAQDRLMKVIAFVRQEKDIACTKSEMLQAESSRLKAQLALMQKQLDEAKAELAASREGPEVSESAAVKHAELMRKMESMNAMIDSNRILREERNRFKEELAEAKAKLVHYEAGINPLQEEIIQLKQQLEAAQTDKEVTSLEVTRWKTRAAQLSERGRVNPEELKKVNAEKDNLSRLLKDEKANNEKLQQNVLRVQGELTVMTESLVSVKKQLATEVAEKQRLNEELIAAKQRVSILEEQLTSSQSEVQALKDQAAKSSAEITAKQAELVSTQAKENQIKKIAKKYKSQYEQLMKTTEEEKQKREEEEKLKAEQPEKPLVIPDEEQERLRAEGRAEVTNQVAELEARNAQQAKELQEQVAVANQEAENLRKDNEGLKVSINDKEERAKSVLKNARQKIASLQDETGQLRGQNEQIRDEYEAKMSALQANIARMEKEKQEQAEERERMANQLKVLSQQVAQLRAQDKPKPSTSSQPAQKSAMEPPTPPTANIKPMAARSKQKQTISQYVEPYWAGANDTPFARIGPVQCRMGVVQPTAVAGSAPTGSIGPGGSTYTLQPVHTTGTSGEAISSSHTDYMPATSSATPVRGVLIANALQSTQEAEAELEPTVPAPQTVAMVTPRVEAFPASPSAGPSSTTSQASSSNTVTTTHAGHKRPRDAEGDSTADDHAKPGPQVKRTRGPKSEMYQLLASSEGSEVEYQVPTSSQRDQEDDMVIMLDSEDDTCGDEVDEEPGDCFEEEENGDGYELERYSQDGQDIGNVYEEREDEDNGGNNEVEIIDDSNEVPALPNNQDQQQQTSEATSSGNDANNHVVVSHAASSQSFRTRSVPPLTRSQQPLQSYDEGGDDSIVPSTPILYLAREAVSSPQVPHQRFTFSEPTPGVSRRDDVSGDDMGSGRSVPSTPLLASPPDLAQEQAEPSVPAAVPNIAVNIDDESMPPPELGAGVPEAPDDQVRQDDSVPETVSLDEDGDGVTSEGEKPPSVGEFVEEGREAEASEPVVRAGTARRSARINVARRGVSRGRPTPIVWNEPGSSGLPSNQRTPGARGATRGRRNW